MTGSAETRARLIDAAVAAFARDGVEHASLLDITRAAGQRNRGAVHYHFGTREGLLSAVVSREAPALLDRELELLDVARGRPAEDLRAALEAFLRPMAELGDRDDQGTDYLQIISQLVARGETRSSEAVSAAIGETGAREVFVLIRERMPVMSEELVSERLALCTTFLLTAVADRARVLRGDGPGRPQLHTATFLDNLLAMTTGMLAAPVG